MSDTKDEPGREPTEEPAGPDAQGEQAPPPEVDLEALAAEEGEGDAEEDGLDLSDIDAYGVDGVVARLRGDGDDPDPVLPPSRPPRSPLVSLVVLVVGGYLLASMFADFSYWLRSSEPDTLGHASTLLEDGRSLDAYDNHYVAIEGTPDIPNALRLTTKERYVGYLRIIEGEGGLFAAIPRSKDERIMDEVEGRFVGRLSRLGDDRAFQWLKQYFETQRISKGVDLDPQAALAALGSASLPTAEGGSVEAKAGAELWLSFDGPDARVQLGVESFSAEEAEAAVAGLGVPYVQLEKTEAFHRFVARIPADEREQAQRKLVAGLEEADAGANPRKGAVVLGLPATYSALAELVSVEGGEVVFPYGDNTTSLGYEVQDGRLVEREEVAQVRLAVDRLRSLRLEHVIVVDPEGYVVTVGQTPSELRWFGVAWLVLLGIVLVNVASLVVWWRGREDVAAVS